MNRKEQRKLSIDLSEIDYVPLIMVKDPEYCFNSITTNDELDFIMSLSQDQLDEIGSVWFDFDEMTQRFRDLIFERLDHQYQIFLKQENRDIQLEQTFSPVERLN